jgi:hypothetical protein
MQGPGACWCRQLAGRHQCRRRWLQKEGRQGSELGEVACTRHKTFLRPTAFKPQAPLKHLIHRTPSHSCLVWHPAAREAAARLVAVQECSGAWHERRSRST